MRTLRWGWRRGWEDWRNRNSYSRQRVKQSWLFDLVDKALTFASVVFTSANIAELIFASAGHVVASLIFFNPKFTTRALFKFRSFNKHHELFIFFVETR